MASSLMPGARFGPYQIVALLGTGAAGSVYLATSDARTRVALKVLSGSLAAEDVVVARFLREARLMQSAESPYVVRVYDAGVQGDRYYLAMEHVSGGDLYERVRKGVMPLGQTLLIASDMVRGLLALGQLGIVHRDVKPENVLLTDDERAKLSDFGLARDLTTGSHLTAVGHTVGTVGYASPEQLLGAPEAASDLYSTGCTIYFALTRRAPFAIDRSPLDALRDKSAGATPIASLRPDIPHDVASAIEAMMEPEAKNRPRDLEGLAQAFQRWSVSYRT